MPKTKKPLLVLDKKRTFFDYFKLNLETGDILDTFGYDFAVSHVTLPQTKVAPERVNDVRAHVEACLPYVNFTSEAARREFLIAPVLLEVVRTTHAKLSVEYPLEVDRNLRGTLDYFLRAESQLLVIEAKNADLTRGFTQLAVELIALDKWLDGSGEVLYGAVSIGDVWRFGTLERRKKLITQDLKLFRVPEELESLLATLIGILKNTGAGKTTARKRRGVSQSRHS